MWFAGRMAERISASQQPVPRTASITSGSMPSKVSEKMLPGQM